MAFLISCDHCHKLMPKIQYSLEFCVYDKEEKIARTVQHELCKACFTHCFNLISGLAKKAPNAR